jgi:hypothetical protein
MSMQRREEGYAYKQNQDRQQDPKLALRVFTGTTAGDGGTERDQGSTLKHSTRNRPADLTRNAGAGTLRMEFWLFPRIRQFAACCLLIVALFHMGAQSASAMLGVPVDYQSGCESISIPVVPSGSETKELGGSGHDGCCDSCCFCCCSHVLPAYVPAAYAICDTLAEPRPAPLYSPGQNIQPGLLPPRA